MREFVNSWNNHPIRTAGHKSPQQLFTAGALLLQNSQLSALDNFEDVDEEYGIDPDGPIASQDGSISVPESTLNFSDSDVSALQQNINPYAPSENYGMDLFEQSLAFISTLTPV